MATHKYYITPSAGVEQEFEARNSELTFVQKRYKEEAFFREVLKTSLTVDNPDIYKPMQKQDLDGCSCHVADVRIESNCCDEIGTRWQGVFPYIKGTWDIDNCKVEFTPTIKDNYTCLIELLKSEKNYLDIPTRTTVKTRYGVIETICCLSFVPLELDANGEIRVYNASDLPPHSKDCVQGLGESDVPNVPNGEGWTISSNYAEVFFTSWAIKTCYSREFFAGTTPPPGNAWIAVLGGFARPIDTTISSVEEGFGNARFTGNDSTTTYIEVKYAYLPDTELDNAIALKDFVLFYLNDCFDCVVSNFLGINPDGTNPQNNEYLKAEQYVHSAIIFQASDVIFADGQNAQNTGGKAGVQKWSEAWEDLRDMFDLIQWYDEESQCLRIEHVSYRRATSAIDLTTDHFKSFVKLKYKSKQEEVPNRQKLRPKYKTDHIDFDDGFINYQSNCTDEDSQEKGKKLKSFITNINRLYQNEDYLDDDNAINSIVLVAVNVDGIIATEEGHKTGETLLNSPFAISNIVRCWWTNERPACYGNVNGVEPVSFSNTKKIKQLEPIKISVTCDQYQLINPETTQIKTKIGFAKIDSMEYDEIKEELELQTLL